jgi:hypothetical protein
MNKHRNLIIASALSVVLTPVASRAQDEAKEKETDRQGFFKRLLKDDDDDPDSKGRGIHWGPFAPRVGILSAGGGPGPTLHFWAPDLGSTKFDIHASAGYSIYKYQYYDLQLGLVPHIDERLPRIETGTNDLFPLADIEKTASAPGFNIYASARYRDYPREDFYGVGPNSLKANRSDYRLQDGLYEGVVRYRFSQLSLMGRAGLLKTSILPGDDDGDPNVETIFTGTSAPGLSRHINFNHASAGAWLELRDEPGNPHRGAAIGVAYSRFDDRDGSAYEFSRMSFDAREYIPLGSKRSVLALRQAVAVDRPDEGAGVPFFMRSTLGGSRFFRPYGSFRYRDDRLLYLASEYRLEVHKRVELALIYEAGKVFPRTTNYSFRDLKHGYGAGIRLKSSRKVQLRLDVVHGDEGNRVHLKLGQSF